MTITDTKKNSKVIYFVSAIAAIAGLLFGFDTGIISGALLFIQKDFALSTLMKELVVSSVLFGAIIGAACSGKFADLFGRKRVILVIAAMFTVGSLAAAFAPSIIVIVAARLLLGVAVGVGSFIAPLYIAEVAPLKMRGSLLAYNQLAITLGILLSYVISLGFASHGDWRWMFAVGVFPAILLGASILFLPESPRWLITKERVQDATKILKFLRNRDNVDHELTSIQESLHKEKCSFKELFSKHIRPVFIVGMVLGLLQQCTGINTIIYYAPTIFQLVGFHSSITSILATVGVGVINVAATIFALRFLDSAGRRPLLLFGLAGMGICLLIISYTLHMHHAAAYVRWVTLVCLYGYISSFAISLGVMLWVLVAEIFPLHIRGLAMGLSASVCWIWNMAVAMTFLTFVDKLGLGDTFLMYAILCVLGWLYCYFFVPETRGVSLETIEQNVWAGKPTRQIGAPIGKSDDVVEPVREVA